MPNVKAMAIATLARLRVNHVNSHISNHALTAGGNNHAGVSAGTHCTQQSPRKKASATSSIPWAFPCTSIRSFSFCPCVHSTLNPVLPNAYWFCLPNSLLKNSIRAAVLSVFFKTVKNRRFLPEPIGIYSRRFWRNTDNTASEETIIHRLRMDEIEFFNKLLIV